MLFELKRLQAFAAELADRRAAISGLQGAIHRASGGIGGLVSEGGHGGKGCGEVTPVGEGFVWAMLAQSATVTLMTSSTVVMPSMILRMPYSRMGR